VGYFSSYIDKANDRHDIVFILSTVHPTFTTLATGTMSPTSRPALVPDNAAGIARPAAVGFVSNYEGPWIFFTSTGMWGIHYQPVPGLQLHHTEQLVLTLLELTAVDGDVFGSFKNPAWKDEISLNKLTVQDHQAKGLVLYGLDGNGAAVGIRLWARPWGHLETDP
jgi:hypothetical protein